MRVAASFPLLLLVAGCAASPAPFSDAPDGLAYAVQPAAAVSGGSVALSLHNGSAEPVGYDLCIGALEQRRGPLWIPALSAARGCPDAWSTLEPGQQAAAEAPLPAPLAPGDYRFVTRLKVPPGGLPVEQVRSAPFSIVQEDGD